MKIVLNIQKKHLFIFIILLLIIGVSVVFGALTEWQNAGNPPSHDTLWTSAIESKSSTDTIAIRDNLIISSGKGINLGGVLRTAWPTGGGTTTEWDDDEDLYIDVTYGGNDCNDNPDNLGWYEHPSSTYVSTSQKDINCNNQIDELKDSDEEVAAFSFCRCGFYDTIQISLEGTSTLFSIQQNCDTTQVGTYSGCIEACYAAFGPKIYDSGPVKDESGVRCVSAQSYYR